MSQSHLNITLETTMIDVGETELNKNSKDKYPLDFVLILFLLVDIYNHFFIIYLL